jgi:putative endonuclease
MDRFSKQAGRKPVRHLEDFGTPSSRIGREGEALAVVFLKKKGYRIVEQNYRCPLGEIDIVALDKRTVCFVEVKTRSTGDYDRPEVAVHKHKQFQLSRVALWFLKERRLQDVRARFDVVAIRKQGSLNEVEHYRNAFEMMDRRIRR